jgi:CheY-like chemotaxis protein
MATLLIVDDNPHLRMFVRLVAEHVGWEVCGEAEDGEEAVERALAVPPDLVLMDYHLPGVDGVTATARIKTAHAEITVVAWSSSVDAEVSGRFLAAGADAHLVKTDLAGLQTALADQLITVSERVPQ